MIKLISGKVACFLCKGEDEETTELFEYAAYIVLSAILHMATVIVLGLCFNMLVESLILKFPSSTIKGITEVLFIGVDKESLLYSDLVVVLGNDFIFGTIEKLHELYVDGLIDDNTKVILSGASGALDAEKDLECN